tara:strand:- start:16034 stop:16339 length:306 start_codon:yes stop_codon:yes gene_type:complete
MTGILVDPATFSLFTLACLAAAVFAAPFPAGINFTYAWGCFFDMAVVWTILVLVAFVPASLFIDTADWNWPPNRRKAVPNPKGGPPRNQWPDHMRFSYFHR